MIYPFLHLVELLLWPLAQPCVTRPMTPKGTGRIARVRFRTKDLALVLSAAARRHAHFSGRVLCGS